MTAADVVLEVAGGRLVGTRTGPVAAFLGIPYAAPPVGARRFQPPAPHEGWSGTRDAKAHGPIAPQRRSLLDQYLGTLDQPIEEDCLTLNVWTPACDGGRRPVLIWIHGGAFTNGAGSSAWYDGAALAATGDAVVVTLNYRLGAFGFTALDDTPGSGNHGLLDQVAALAWVSEHATTFGGDPGNVTIFGESAGGTSTVCLLAMPAAQALFHRAIVQSASFPQLRSLDAAREAAAQLLDRLGVPDADPARLAAVEVEQVLAAQQAVCEGPTGWFTAFSPVADGVVLPATVGTLLATAARSPVPVVIGTTLDEMRLFTLLDPAYGTLDDAGLAERAAAALGEAAPAALAVYRDARPGATPGELASALATDQSFRQPALRFAQARVDAGTSTWMYRFSWPSPTFGGLLGACHGIELPFVFGTLDAPGVELLTGDSPHRAQLAGVVGRSWLAFARDGAAPWPAYDRGDRSTLRLDLPTVVDHDPDGELRRLWEGAR